MQLMHGMTRGGKCAFEEKGHVQRSCSKKLMSVKLSRRTCYTLTTFGVPSSAPAMQILTRQEMCFTPNRKEDTPSRLLKRCRNIKECLALVGCRCKPDPVPLGTPAQAEDRRREVQRCELVSS